MMWLLDWISGGIVGQITKPLVKAYEMKLSAQNEHEKLAADITIKQLEGDMAARQAAKEIRISTANFWEMRMLTFMIAAPFVVHAGAVGLDTTFGLGWAVAAYPPPFDEWEGAILLSFFGIQAGIVGIKSLAWAIGKRR